MTDNQPTEAMVENIAISIHYADGDPATVKWAKQSGKYRASLRRNVRDVLAAIDRLGLRFQSPDKERGETPAPADQMQGCGEPIAYVCEADILALANKPDGTDFSIAPRPFPEYGMNFPLYAKPQLPGDAVRSALSELVDYYTATEDAELFQEEARLLENARHALKGSGQ